MTGVVSDDDRTVSLFGQAPLRDAQCRLSGYRDDRLEFTFHDHEDNWGRDVSNSGDGGVRPEPSVIPELQRKTAEFINRHYAKVSGPNADLLSAVSGLYADRVEYFGATLCPVMKRLRNWEDL